MRAKPFFYLLLVGALTSSTPRVADASHPPSEALFLLAQAQDEAEALDNMIHRTSNRALERRLKRRLRRLETLLDELEREIRRPPQRRVSRDGGFSGMIVVEDLADVPLDLPMREVDPTDFEAPIRTTPDDLERITEVLELESFSDGKLSALRTVIPNRSFTVSQVIAMLDAFPFGDDKVSAASLLFPQVEDHENWYRVYGALDFDSDREALRRRTSL